MTESFGFQPIGSQPRTSRIVTHYGWAPLLQPYSKSATMAVEDADSLHLPSLHCTGEALVQEAPAAELSTHAVVAAN